MSRSYWLPIIALGLTLATAALGAVPLERPHETEDAQADAPSDSDEQGIERLAPIGVPVAVYPSQNEANEPESQPNEDDPYKFLGDSFAQWLMALLGFVGTGVSIWAVCLLKQTMKANQGSTDAAIKMATLAQESHIAEHRTWLDLMCIEIGPVSFDGAKFDVSLKIRTKNIGKSVALNVNLGCSAYHSENIVAGAALDRLIAFEQTVASANPKSGRPLIPEEHFTCEFGRPSEVDDETEIRVAQEREVIARYAGGQFPIRPMILTIIFCVNYKCIGSDKWFHRGHIMYVRKTDYSDWSPQDESVNGEALRCTIIPSETLIN